MSTRVYRYSGCDCFQPPADLCSWPKEAGKGDAMSYLKGIATGLSLATCAFMLVAGAASDTARFKSIDVERINIREPDGTLRMVLSNRAEFPGLVHRQQEHPHPGRTHAAGMLFYNDEGTENGGLIYSGRTTENGVEAGASLTFDRYEQDQVVQLLQTESGPHSMAGLIVSDRPSGPIDPAASAAVYAAADGAEREAAIRAANIGGASRLFLGRSRDRNSMIMLQDANGIPRLSFMVTPEGQAAINFHDENGQPTKTITAN